jgi:hypothetical protein
MSLAILIGVSFSLTACQSPVSGCPPLPQYSAATQKQLAAELRSLPKGALLGRVVVDYKKLRDACRLGG